MREEGKGKGEKGKGREREGEGKGESRIGRKEAKNIERKPRGRTGTKYTEKEKMQVRRNN